MIARRKTCWPSVPAATLVCGDFKLHANASPIAKDPIDRNVFSVRVRNALYHASIVSWEQLQRLGKAELLTIRGIGVTAVEEILDVLGSRGVRSTTPKALASRMMEREAALPTTHKEEEQAKETAVEEKQRPIRLTVAAASGWLAR